MLKSGIYWNILHVWKKTWNVHNILLIPSWCDWLVKNSFLFDILINEKIRFLEMKDVKKVELDMIAAWHCETLKSIFVSLINLVL